MLETALHDLVCAHRMTLTDALNAIATDWVSAYRQVLGTPPPAPENATTMVVRIRWWFGSARQDVVEP